MNTIPTIFNERQINTTILGGKMPAEKIKMNVAVILLNSNGSHFRVQMLENLVNCGFASIVSIEPNRDNINIEENARRFPTVKFIIPLEQVTEGEMINIGMSEVNTAYVLVLRDTLSIPPGIISPRFVEKLIKLGNYCIVPRLLNSEKQSVAVRSTPFANRGHLRMEMSSVVPTDTPTVYPFDFIGLYNREKFIQLGGFDYTILSPYYQNVDLGLRSWLWGEITIVSPAFQLTYAEDVPIDTTTADITYLHFYLKNMLPVFKYDHGVIPAFSFFRFLGDSSCGFFEARKLFKDAVNWTYTNRYRFQTDIKNLIENWNTLENKK